MEVQTLTIKPGDMVLITTEDRLDAKTVEDLRVRAEGLLGCKVVVLAHGLKLSVIQNAA